MRGAYIQAYRLRRPDLLLDLRTVGLGGSGFSEFVLTAGRAAPPLDRRHPCRGTAAALAAPASQPFEGDNSFLYLLSLLAQISQHFHNIHSLLPVDKAFRPERGVLNSEQNARIFP
jgi:hypothetical protein